jgi:hypothetical protein
MQFILFTGIELTTMVADYAPFLFFGTCKKEHFNCQTKGILAESFAILGKMFNFSLRIDYTKNWGSVPVVSWVRGLFTIHGLFS